MEATVGTAILGSGNIGTDLMYKLGRSPILKLAWMVGVVPESEGLRLARERGVKTTHQGIEGLLEHPQDFEIVFDATTAKAHRKHAELLKPLGKIVVDLTPAALGPPVVPLVNLSKHLQESDVNLTTCGGQATIPIVGAIHRAAPVEYAEIVATISSRSAGPGTRQNIDEFTETTARGLVQVGGAKRGKALIILNPAEPPILMRNTIYCRIDQGADRSAIQSSVDATVRAIQEYVPGYRLKTPPIFDDSLVTILLEVEGAGDYLPKYAGNLDIMTSAAVRVAEELARTRFLQTGSGQSERLSTSGVPR